MNVRGIAEIVLIVSDLEQSTRFYRDVVGLEVETPPSDGWAWFIAGNASHEQRIALRNGSLLFEEFSPNPEGQRWGRVHFALHVPHEELEDATRKVRESGTEVYGPTHFDWMNATSYYFYDPEGNLVEFWSPESPATHEPTSSQETQAT